MCIKNFFMKFINRLLLNRNFFCGCFRKTLNLLFGILSAVLLFISFEDIGLGSLNICIKCIMLIIPVIVSVVLAIIRVYRYEENVILNDTQLSIVIRYGNLWDFSFAKSDEKERIVVVGVNTAYDVIVDSPSVVKPLVSENTIHGQWVRQMEKHGVKQNELNQQIEDSLRQQNISPLKTIKKPRGNSLIYRKGTIALVKYNKTTFYLLAMSDFDENNNAHSSKQDLRDVIVDLVDFIGRHSQGADVYIPLMGCGNSRTGIKERDALELLISTLMYARDDICGNINVVVYEKYRDIVSIER